MYEDLRNWRLLIEGKKESLVLDSLPYKKTELLPAISQDTLDYHYGHLAKGYVERFNSNQGDRDFNRAGAFLHNILFSQYKQYSTGNKPKDSVHDFIEDLFGNFKSFQEEFAKVAMGIQGSGWVYLSKSGQIKTIVNHQIKNDILLLVDWWEHAWALDYQHDKAKYLENQWRIINWAVIQHRLQTS
jgi:Fe-Mn family superoxide dismutase